MLLFLADDIKRSRESNKKRKLLPPSVLSAVSNITQSIVTGIMLLYCYRYNVTPSIVTGIMLLHLIYCYRYNVTQSMVTGIMLLHLLLQV